MCYGGRYLIDGGILNTTPVDVLRPLTGAPVVAVDVSLPKDMHVELLEEQGLFERLTSPLSEVTLPLDLVNKAFTIAQGRLAELRLAMHPPDIYIRPELSDMLPGDYRGLEEATVKGYEAATEVLDRERVLEKV